MKTPVPFQGLPLRIRMATLAGVLLAASLIFSGHYGWSVFDQWQQAVDNQKVADLSIVLGRMSHANAVERGLTSQYLASPTQANRLRMMTARGQSQQTQRAFETQSRHLDLFISDSESIQQTLTEWLQERDQIRRDLNGSVESVDADRALQIFDRYSSLNTAVLLFQEHLVPMVESRNLVRRMQAIIQLAWIEERLSQVRGLVAGLRGVVSPASELRTSSDVTLMKLRQQEFEQFVSEADQQALVEIIDTPAMGELQDYLARCVRSGQAVPQTCDSNHWFDRASMVINQVASLREGMIDGLRTVARQGEKQALQWLVGGMLFNALLLLAALVAVRQIWRDMTHGTLSILAALDADGGRRKELGQGSQDEFELLRHAVAEMVERQSQEIASQRSARASSDRRFRSIFENSDQYVVLLNADGVVTDINPDALRFTGMQRSAVVGSRFLLLPWHTGRKDVAQFLSHALEKAQSGLTVRLNLPVQLGDESRTLAMTMVPIIVDGGKLDSVLVEGRDVTELRRAQSRAEQALQAQKLSESKWQRLQVLYRNIFDNAGVGLLRTGTEGQIEQANLAFADMLGTTPSNLVGHRVAEIIHPDDVAKSSRAIALARQGEIVLPVEKRYLKASGEIVWAEIRLTRDADCLIASVVDISDRRAQDDQRNAVQSRTERLLGALRLREKELSDSRNRLNAIIENAPSLIYVKDLQGRYVLANRKAAQVASGMGADLIGATDFDLLPREQAEADRALDRQVIESGNAQRFEATWPDGQIMREYVVVKFPMRGANGETSGVGGIATDIGDLKQAQRDMFEAKDEAERANRAKSDFLATVTHEMRTPLNGIIGMLELISSDQGKIDQKGGLRTVQDAAVSLTNLINDVLDFSKLESEHLELDLAPFELSAVIEGVVNLLGPKAQQGGIEIKMALDPNIPAPLLGDSGRLRQVLFNLVGNALKFTRPSESGNAKVQIGATLLGEKNSNVDVELQVRDSGIGITSEEMSRLFQPYEQAKPATATEFGGTGLGLAISKLLIDAMGGDIRVESVSGQGACFTVRLQLPRIALDVDASSDELGEGAIEASEPGATWPCVQSKATARPSVLLVEDNLTNLDILTAQLEQLGCAVDAAESGAQALEKFRGRRYDIVLSDCHMPGMDGFELTRCIRQLESDSHLQRTPIIAVTANAMRSEVQRCLASGFDDFLAKPVRKAEIAARLGKWLQGMNGISAQADQGKADRVDLEIYDPTVLYQAVGDSQALQRRLLQRFVEESRSILEQLLVPNLGANALRGLMHRWKSSSKSVGATQLSRLCDELESAAARLDSEALHQECNQVATAFQEVEFHILQEIRHLHDQVGV